MKTEKDNLQKIEKDIIIRTNEASDSKFNWWSEFLFNASKNSKLEQQIMDRIYNELRNYKNPAMER